MESLCGEWFRSDLLNVIASSRCSTGVVQNAKRMCWALAYRWCYGAVIVIIAWVALKPMMCYSLLRLQAMSPDWSVHGSVTILNLLLHSNTSCRRWSDYRMVLFWLGYFCAVPFASMKRRSRQTVDLDSRIFVSLNGALHLRPPQMPNCPGVRNCSVWIHWTWPSMMRSCSWSTAPNHLFVKMVHFHTIACDLCSWWATSTINDLVLDLYDHIDSWAANHPVQPVESQHWPKYSTACGDDAMPRYPFVAFVPVSLFPYCAHSLDSLDSLDYCMVHGTHDMHSFHIQDMICSRVHRQNELPDDTGSNSILNISTTKILWNCGKKRGVKEMFRHSLTEIAIIPMATEIVVIAIVGQPVKIVCTMIRRYPIVGIRTGGRLIVHIGNVICFLLRNIGEFNKWIWAGFAPRWWCVLCIARSRCVRCIIWAQAAGGRNRWS